MNYTPADREKLVSQYQQALKQDKENRTRNKNLVSKLEKMEAEATMKIFELEDFRTQIRNKLSVIRGEIC